jgi:SSS family solute:Na+ symporter
LDRRVLVIKRLHSDRNVYLQSVQGYMSPAIAALFLFGVFWKRATAPAALYAFNIGLAGGIARFVADLIVRNDGGAVAGSTTRSFCCCSPPPCWSR